MQQNLTLKAEIRALEQELANMINNNMRQGLPIPTHRADLQVQDDLSSNSEVDVEPQLHPQPTTPVIYQLQPKIRQPKNFTLQDDIHLFLQKFQNFVIINKLEDNTAKNFLLASLDDKPLKIINNLNLKDNLSYTELKNILKEKFGDQLGKVGNSLKLQNLSQQENQDIFKFIEEIKDTLHLNNISEEDQVKILIDKLSKDANENIRKIVIKLRLKYEATVNHKQLWLRIENKLKILEKENKISKLNKIPIASNVISAPVSTSNQTNALGTLQPNNTDIEKLMIQVTNLSNQVETLLQNKNSSNQHKIPPNKSNYQNQNKPWTPRMVGPQSQFPQRAFYTYAPTPHPFSYNNTNYCSYCHRYGHTLNFCFKKYPNLNQVNHNVNNQHLNYHKTEWRGSNLS
jgi:hypothetical protein